MISICFCLFKETCVSTRFVKLLMLHFNNLNSFSKTEMLTNLPFSFPSILPLPPQPLPHTTQSNDQHTSLKALWLEAWDQRKVGCDKGTFYFKNGKEKLLCRCHMSPIQKGFASGSTFKKSLYIVSDNDF